VINRIPIQAETKSKLIKGLLLAGGLYLGYRVSSKAIKNWKSRGTASLADQSPEVRQAMGLRSAINPSGVSWLMWSDGTNEDAIEQIASQISDLDSVAVAYRNLYGKELIKQLQGELDSDRFNAFLQTVSNNRINQSTNSNVPTGAYSSPQKLIVAKRSVYVRTTPDASYHGGWYEIGEEKNIYKTATEGEFIGYATGKQHYDSKNNVKFIEVAFQYSVNLPSDLSDQAGKTKLLWVSSSANYVSQFDSNSDALQTYPGIMAQLNYMLPIPGLGWLSMDGSRVVSKKPTQVLSKDFKPLCHVDKGVLLGYPVMSLQGTDTDMTMLRTLSGLDRWVKTSEINIV
jgi:hypothetical protein